MSTAQHAEALRVLALIRAAGPDGPVLTYPTVAAQLGRDPGNSSRAIAQVCDLLDAAAAHAEVPALALVRVRNADKKINPNAWQKNAPPGLREAINQRAEAHLFTDADFTAIGKALADLTGLGNRAAWKKVLDSVPVELIHRSLKEGRPAPNLLPCTGADERTAGLPRRAELAGCESRPRNGHLQGRFVDGLRPYQRIWPRISPPGKPALCALKYRLPCL